jgi:hypothetical protein
MDDGRRAGGVVERDRAPVRERRLDRQLLLAEGHVGGREVEAGIEQRADGEERVRLARARLADQRRDRPRPHDEPARTAEVDGADLLEQGAAHAPVVSATGFSIFTEP